MLSGTTGLDQSINTVQDRLKRIVQNLYSLIVQGLDHQGNATQNAMKVEIHRLVVNLVELSRTAPGVAVDIPPEIIHYVEQSRNPDIFTREFVELSQRMNQMLKGRSLAFAEMRDILARDIVSARVELQDDVRRVIESTGSTIEA
ncbi:RNA polymeras-like protein II mediator complex subunit 10 [Zopfia rhizophila CBS 207.26]|uniref:Mediator of RNA polymerase II transcription subunit 10 n=1 Tax=Zopfia rhizophila CBS 207.26 TaxID=1314779 RepID=A0A6A6DU36_9PEZI|nr:RNA polymeras-like protein II mediator complex subunit 10 [Zopfia rhizophila CBS 207.26]